MESLFKLKNPNDNIHLLAFQYHTLEYSIEVLKNRKKELKSDPNLKNKIDNYLLMERLYFEQELKKEDLPFNLKDNANDYINNPRNSDLKNYMNICKHIVAKELDMVELCSKVDFFGHLFVAVGKDLYCVDCDLSTVDNTYNDIEKRFLYSCAKRKRRIIQSEDSNSSNVRPLYNNKELEVNNLISVA